MSNVARRLAKRLDVDVSSVSFCLLSNFSIFFLFVSNFVISFIFKLIQSSFFFLHYWDRKFGTLII